MGCRNLESTTPLGLEVDRVGKHEVEVGAARDDGADEIFRGNPHPALDLLRCFFLLHKLVKVNQIREKLIYRPFLTDKARESGTSQPYSDNKMNHNKSWRLEIVIL